MTALPDRLGSASYETESSWAESTDTFGTRLRLLGPPVVPQDIQERIAEPITQQYAEEGKAGVRGPWQGSFRIQFAITGHGTAPTGSLTATDLYNLLKNIIGGGSVAGAGTTVDSFPTSASEFALVGGTVATGDMIRVGTKGDGRGNGQFAVVDNASTITLLTALDATPNAADVVYASQTVFPTEVSGISAITSTRWLLQTANGQWKARGCFPSSISISQGNPGEMLVGEAEFMVSRWEEVNETFPSATAADDKDAGINAAGSLFINDYGTATRSTHSYRSWSLNLTFESVALPGTGGQDAYQTIVGALRTRVAADFSVQFDAEAAGTTTWADKFDAGTMQHVLFTLNSVAGKALGFYFPNAEITQRPTQESSDGLNRVSVNFRALTDTTESTDLAAASFKLAMG